ncbi:phage transcriptional regulator AlpA [Bifidobacterium moukalabense DSM 27321]|uniref:Phage transcriptional regulator AlpA n=2 Tax=Bifidobacterium moukalabense TaxID=1333651 RepID=W4NAU6_9BIFI|nr:phage transcriptional regulator AlpA [Bifidobacterium moukalabense DSM 27321]
MLRSREAARMIGISPRTLAKWRQRGVGPQCVRLGYNLVVYRLSDIDAWIRTRACSAPKATADDLEGTIGLDCTGGLNSVDYISRLRDDRTIKTGKEESKESGMKAEYHELTRRTDRLRDLLAKYADGTLDFEPACPIALLSRQLDVMDEYALILRRRANIEHIDLGEQLIGTGILRDTKPNRENQ